MRFLDSVLVGVPVDTASRTWKPGTESKLIDLPASVGTGGWYGTYDIAPDGRIVIIRRPEALPEVSLVLHWNRELARLAPAK